MPRAAGTSAGAPRAAEESTRRPARASNRPRALWIAAAVIGVLAVGAGGIALGAAVGRGEPAASAPTSATTGSPSPEPDPPEPNPSEQGDEPAPSSTPDAVRVALVRLDALPIVSGRSDAAYDRDRFGQRWADVDRNGCDTRNDILGRDLLDPVFKPGTRECKVLGGTLIDPYDGSRVEFVSGYDTSVLVQIDHVVALAWAWRHGAEHWTDEQRTRFANDPANLVAASEATNQAKSASGPSEWLPPARELRCGYVENWIEVLSSYRLGVNARDKAAAQAVLATC